MYSVFYRLVTHWVIGAFTSFAWRLCWFYVLGMHSFFFCYLLNGEGLVFFKWEEFCEFSFCLATINWNRGGEKPPSRFFYVPALPPPPSRFLKFCLPDRRHFSGWLGVLFKAVSSKISIFMRLLAAGIFDWLPLFADEVLGADSVLVSPEVRREIVHVDGVSRLELFIGFLRGSRARQGKQFVNFQSIENEAQC